MTSQQVALWVCTAVLFITVTIAGVFAVELMAMWLKNRREERANRILSLEARSSERFDTERDSWIQLIRQKDAEIVRKDAEIVRKDAEIVRLGDLIATLNKNYDIANRLMENAEFKKEEAA